MDVTELAARHDFFHRLIVNTITMLMTDHGLHTARIETLGHLEAFRAGKRNWLLHGNQARSTRDAYLDHRRAHIRHGAETENVGLDGTRNLGCVRPFDRGAELGGCGIDARSVDVANPGHFKPAIRLESSGVVHAPLPHTDHNYLVFAVHVLSRVAVPSEDLLDRVVHFLLG